MFTPAQLARLSPVVADAWERHCDQNDLDPHRKASNGYRAWYEGILEAATGKTTTKDLAGARDFGEVLLAFAQAAGDERLIRDLAEDEEHRHRWVLRMLAVDLSYLRGEVVGWEYVRALYGQSKLPPGEFEDCPADLLKKVIQMLDTQVRRECARAEIRPCEIPRRAKANPGHLGEHIEGMHLHLRILAYKRGLTAENLLAWHDALVKAAEAELWQRRNRSAANRAPQKSFTFDDSSETPPF
jgi:hypothetical protein